MKGWILCVILFQFARSDDYVEINGGGLDCDWDVINNSSTKMRMSNCSLKVNELKLPQITRLEVWYSHDWQHPMFNELGNPTADILRIVEYDVFNEYYNTFFYEFLNPKLAVIEVHILERFLLQKRSREEMQMLSFNPRRPKEETLNNVFKNFTQLKSVRIYKLQANNLDENSFQNNRELEEIDLFINDFTTLDNLTANLTKLEKINLAYNSFENVSEKSFRDNVNLKEIDLCSNLIKKISEKAFGTLLNLKFLRLCYNQIEEIEENAFENNKQIIKLNFNHNKIKVIQNVFKHMKQLEELELEDNQIEHLSRTTFQGNRELRKLILDENKLENVDHLFDNLVKLEKLVLTSNKISSLSEDIFKDNENLETLDLGSNEIEIITSRTFEGLQNLKTLELQRNQIHSLSDDAFINNKHLEEVGLAHNKIFEIGNQFRHLSALKILSLSNNPIQLDLSGKTISCNANIFKHNRNLIKLYLASNSIKDLDKGIFHFPRFNHLRILDLKENKIEIITKRTFDGLPNLENLLLEGNQIFFLSIHAFSNNKNLEEIGLRNNKIIEIGSQFRHLYRIYSLTLEGNPIKRIEENAFANNTLLDKSYIFN